MLRDV